MAEGLKTFNWPLNGRLITKLDGTLIPDAHFQVLENLRYNDGGIEGVKGQTKINASALAKLKVQNGFHFKKSIPSSENHIFAQVTNTADSTSAIYKSDNSTSIPAQDTFTLFKTLDSDNTVYFSEAPDQSMVFCDGYHNYLYSGSEYRSAKVINFDPSGTYSYDYTRIANNNLTDSNNTFSLTGGLGGGLDSDTITLLSLNNNVTDSATAGNAPFTYTATNITYSTTYKVFGTHGASFNGTSSKITTPDAAEFDFSATGTNGIFTIDCRCYITSLSANRPIYYQQIDTDNYLKLYVDTNGAVILSIYDTASEVVSVTTPNSTILVNTWYHIALVENGDSWYIFVDGVLSGSATDTSRAQNYTGVVNIGTDGSAYYVGYMDEFRVSSSARWTANFSVPLIAYNTNANYYYLYIGSTRPIDGIKFYIQTANATTSTVAVYYWSGASWTAVSSLTDGTASGGITLAATGTMSFTSTVDLCKVKAINENVAYYYQLVFTDIDSTTDISQITVSCPVQDIKDLWDGVPRQIFSFLKYTSSYSDLTTNVYSLDYDSSDTTTYASVGALTSSQYLYFGFNEALLGMKFYLAETNVNTNSALMYIDYWNGSAWTTVGAIDDGTSVDGKSFNRTGVVTWNPPAASAEFIKSVSNSSEWYYYRVHFSATLSTTVRLDTITGIPTQVEIPPYRFPVLWQNRIWLLNDQASNKNTGLGSSYGTVCVFNGTDSGILTFGGSKEVNCGSTLFTRYGGSLYENMIVCKNNETYLVDGVSFTGDSGGTGAFVVYQVSGTRGCIAPLTMKQCDTGYEVAPGITKHILTWLANSGVVMFDSNSMIEVSNDIGDRFMPYNTYSINRSVSDQSTAFYDASLGEYHLLIPVGSSTYLNEEWVYDVIRKKWYQAKRGAKYLWCGFTVEDQYGNLYIYGGTGDGFLERLEYGTTFDGVGIAYKFRMPDSLLNNSWDSRKEIREIRLVGKCKTTTTQTIAVSHYADGSTTASTPSVVAIANKESGKRFYNISRSVSLKGTTHSLEFSITTTDENGGFDPLLVAGTFRVLEN